MEPYLFYGVVLPERAQLSFRLQLEFSHVSGFSGVARISIVMNQVVVWVESDHEWDIFDLRNVVKNIVQTQLAMVGYLKGFAYDLEVTRVLHRGRGIDYVFGIDIPIIAERGKGVDLDEALKRLRAHTAGPHGVFVHRCFTDLASAMKHADDTGFFCYRAIESLRHHCAAVHGLASASKSKQWQKFREVSGCTEEALLTIKAAADPLRHGEASRATAKDRERHFTNAWSVVDAYLQGA